LVVLAAGTTQATTLTDLFGGESITAGDKTFDQWTLDFYDSSDFSEIDYSAINVTALDDGAMDPGPGLSFDLGQEMQVTGDGIYAYKDLTFSFRVTPTSPNRIDGASLGGYDAFYGYSDNAGDAGSYVLESIGTFAGADDLAVMDAEFSHLDGIGVSDLSDMASFAPQDSIYVTKNILVWASLETDSAGLTSFDQRFSQSPIPEPTTFVLFGTGLGMIGLLVRRRKK